MLLSLQLLPEQPASELLDSIAVADRLGYHACYSADEIYHKDAWLLFAAAAERTERIRLGPCVAPIYMREPTYVAQLAATLDELSDGRAEIVVRHRQHRDARAVRRRVARNAPDRPPAGGAPGDADAPRRGRDRLRGDFYRYTGVTTAARPVQEHLPLKIGAMGGPKSMELAGEIADGLLTACAYSPEALGYAVEHFRAGVERASRSMAGLDLGDSLLGAIAPDGEVARRAGRILAAFYIPSMPPALLERHGIEPEQVAPVSEAFAAGDVQRALEATPDEVADRIMVAGTPEDWVAWLKDTYAPAGLNHALVSFTDPFTLRAWAGTEVEGLPDLGEQVRLLGEQVLPEISSL